MPSPVIVNLDVTQDASGVVNIFSQASPVITNEVVVSKTLSLASSLYTGDASGSALFQFQGQGDSIAAKVNSTYAGTAEADLTSKLQECLCASSGTSLDAVDAAAFSGYSAENSAYYTFDNLGRMALAYYAHHIFGHVQATAAIDNDTAIVDRFNGQGALNADVAAGLSEKVVGMTDAAALEVVKQVLGQDSSRAEDVDNDLSSPASWQNLRFYAGDIIYVSVRIQRPAVSIVDDAAQLGAEAGIATGASATRVPTDTTYMMQITLAA